MNEHFWLFLVKSFESYGGGGDFTFHNPLSKKFNNIEHWTFHNKLNILQKFINAKIELRNVFLLF